MSKSIEVSIKVPKNSKTPLLDENGYPIDMASVRFKTVMSVEAIPKPGDTLQMAAGDQTFDATVVRADWSDERGMFIVSCQFARRSISVVEQAALMADTKWSLVPLI